MSFDHDNAFTKVARWIAAGAGLDNGAIVWSGQGSSVPKDGSGVPFATWISANLISSSGVGSDWTKLERNYLQLANDVIESVDAGTDELTLTAHAYQTGDGPVRLTTTDTLPGGTAVATDYWVVVVDIDTVKLTATRAAAVAAIPSVFVDVINAGVGVHTIVDTDETTRVLEDVAHTSEGHRTATLSLQCFGGEAVGAPSPKAVLERVRNAYRLPTQQERMREAGMAVASIGTATLRGGSASSASALEPRAVLEAQLNYIDGATELGTFIEDVEIDLEISV